MTSRDAEDTDAADRRTDTGQPASAVPQPIEATDESIDATRPLRAIYQPIEATDQSIDATQPLRAIYQPIEATGQLIDATQPLRAIRQPINFGSDAKQLDLPTLVRTILLDLKPSEREVIELNFRHGLNDTDLATVLGMSWSKAHSLASRARNRLEQALAALLIARTGRGDCPELDALLAESDGQLTEKTRDLVRGHSEACEKCAAHKFGALRTAAISELLPLAPLPPGLRSRS